MRLTTVVALVMLVACTPRDAASPAGATATPTSSAVASRTTVLPSPTSTVGPTYPAVSKPTPCPSRPYDATRTGVEGDVTWDGTPMAGIRVGIRQPGAPSSGPIEESAVTDANGHYRITGARPGVPYFVSAPAQDAYVETNGGGFTVCGNETARVAPIELRRAVTGVDLPSSSLIGDTLSTRWDPVPHADRYCVAVYYSGGAATSGSECQRYLPAAVSSVAPRITVSGLSRDHVYFLAIRALHGDRVVGALPEVPSLTFAVGPLQDLGPCATLPQPPAGTPNQVIDWFFRLLDEGRGIEMAACWADATPDRLELMRAYVATGGTDRYEISEATPLKSGDVAVRVIVHWKAGAVFGAWGSGQTKWLIVGRQADGRWAIESTWSALPADAVAIPLAFTLPTGCGFVGAAASDADHTEWHVTCGDRYDRDARGYLGRGLEAQGWAACGEGLATGAWKKDGLTTLVIESSLAPGDYPRLVQYSRLVSPCA